MKLLSSFKKELVLASRSFYFYIEIGMAVIILVVLLFAIPEHSQLLSEEYIFLDMPEAAAEYMREEFLKNDTDGVAEQTEIEAGDKVYEATLLQTEESQIYILETEEAVEALAKEKKNIGAVIALGDDNQAEYKYYLQGYESERLKNLLRVLHELDIVTLEDSFDAQEVRTIQSDYQPLNDRENTIPPLMTFSGSLMSMFVMASYIFLDKKEGVIKAFAVTAAPVSRYLLSKVLVLIVTTVVAGLIIVVPIMGVNANYALLLLLLVTSSFFAAVLGLLVASFYTEITKAFGAIFILVILFMIPGLAYFIPSWDPGWVRLLPSYPMQQGFKEIITRGGDVMYVLLASAGFAAVGAVLFAITNIRFKRSLSA